MRSFALFLCCLFANSAVAQDWAVLEGDVQLTSSEVIKLVSGHVLVFYDGGASTYDLDGGYTFTYANGFPASGKYGVENDGRVCVSFENGRSRCDRFVSSRGRFVLLTSKGERYPVRP